jgi:hypothetical protein
MFLIDSCATNSIFRETKYFQTFTKRTGNILTVVGRDACIVGSEKATITLYMGTQVIIENALLYPDSTHTLLSYREIHNNGLHMVTHEDYNEKYLLITKSNGDGYDILERIPSLPSILYYTYTKLVPYVVYKVISQNVYAIQTWHDRQGHLGIWIMRKIIGNFIGHNLKRNLSLGHSLFMAWCDKHCSGYFYLLDIIIS